MLIWSRSNSLPPVRFADGRTTRILKISLGTNHVFCAEPSWKQMLRRVLPVAWQKPLGRPKEYNRKTLHDSLALYLEPLTPPNGMERWNVQIETLFPDGTAYPVDWQSAWNPASHYPIVLQSYPRGEKEVVVRLLEAGRTVNIKIPNPRPTRRAVWNATALPQTNNVAGTDVVMTGWRHSESVLSVRSNGSRAVGWMQWRTTLFDSWGNWEEGSPRRFPGAKSESIFKVVAVGLEYISAGFVERPALGEYQILSHNATNWGVQFLALFGPGTYEISKGFLVQTQGTGLLRTNTLILKQSSWIVQCAEPAALCISHSALTAVRIRERVALNEGRVLGSARMPLAERKGVIAQLFTPRLPAITTNLEVELIVRWPPAEFFVEKPRTRWR